MVVEWAAQKVEWKESWLVGWLVDATVLMKAEETVDESAGKSAAEMELCSAVCSDDKKAAAKAAWLVVLKVVEWADEMDTRSAEMTVDVSVALSAVYSVFWRDG